MRLSEKAGRFFCCLTVLLAGLYVEASAQCTGADIMEPGFAFLSSSRGCAPFTVGIQTIYLASTPGTEYYIDWGDGTAEETYTQGPLPAVGVIMTHTYPLASINCGYDVFIDASNACNPRGSVVPIQTSVIVWTNDVISINPLVYRVCAGYAANVQFTDDSDWNCFPRATRENNEPRWIQWIYGTGSAATQIPGINVNSIAPGGFPYLDPAPLRNPIFPVTAPGLLSLPINVPLTTPADIGKNFQITLKNWNQCNAYDNNLANGPLNPADLVNGDNPPQVTTAQIVIVDAPQPTYVTRLAGAGGPIQTMFCINDLIYFDNNTPPIGGAAFQYTWEFFDNGTGAGAPIGNSTNTNPTFSYGSPGQKLIRLSVRDQNAAGNCVAIYDAVITITPSLLADIQITDFANIPITPDFCQNPVAPFTAFQVRFSDASIGTVTPTTRWRWEFYDENGILVQQAPAAGFSSVPLGPFDRLYTNRGIYRAKLIVRDNVTSCETSDEVFVHVFQKPVPLFSANRVCQGLPTTFTDASTLTPTNGESIVLREWDFNYDGTFNKDPAFDNQTTFTRSLGTAATYQVALRVTTNQFGCSDMVVIPVIVDGQPNASFTPDVSSGCSVLRVTFTNNSVAGQPAVIDRFVWEVDDHGGGGFQTVGTQFPASPTFSNQFVHDFVNTTTVGKIFDVRITAVAVNTCQTISTPVAITVFPGTKSGFVSTNYSPFNDNCSPVNVNFSVDAQTQSLTPTNYRWRVSDASGLISDVSTGTVPTYTYNFVNPTQLIKDFSVRLTTTLSSGCFGDSVRTIRVSPVPVSGFTIDTLIFDCQRMRLEFSAEQKGLQYHWVISENGVVMLNSTGTNDIQQYEVTRVGLGINLSISLDTENIANCVSTVTTKTLVIPKRDVINTSFTVTPMTQTLPSSTVSITNTTNTGLWTYLWDFGDGTTSTSSAAALQHTYALAGTFVIKLTVTNNGCVETQSRTLIINPIPPIVNFTYNPPSGCAPLTVTFTNLSKFADPETYVWDFGDGDAKSKATNPTHTYFQPGTFSVSLSATNVTGQVISELKVDIIIASPSPTAQFDVTPRRMQVPGQTLYTNNKTLNADQFEWSFGDGGTSNEFEPSHTYLQAGVYDISLIAISENGCRDTLTMKGAVTVVKGGQLHIPNAFSPNLNGGGAGGSGGGTTDPTQNDVFLPLMYGVTEFEMLVFNRWGQLLFQSQDPTIGWDGYFNGQLCEQDVYVYKITARMEDGERIVRTGDINLIR